jgi:hypothetical protein
MKRLSLISMIIVRALLASGTEVAPQSELQSAASSSSDRDWTLHALYRGTRIANVVPARGGSAARAGSEDLE